MAPLTLPSSFPKNESVPRPLFPGPSSSGDERADLPRKNPRAGGGTERAPRRAFGSSRARVRERRKKDVKKPSDVPHAAHPSGRGKDARTKRHEEKGKREKTNEERRAPIAQYVFGAKACSKVEKVFLVREILSKKTSSDVFFVEKKRKAFVL